MDGWGCELDTNSSGNQFLEQFQKVESAPSEPRTAISAASVVDSAVCICVMDAQEIGHST